MDETDDDEDEGFVDNQDIISSPANEIHTTPAVGNINVNASNVNDKDNRLIVSSEDDYEDEDEDFSDDELSSKEMVLVLNTEKFDTLSYHPGENNSRNDEEKSNAHRNDANENNDDSDEDDDRDEYGDSDDNDSIDDDGAREEDEANSEDDDSEVDNGGDGDSDEDNG